MATAGSAKGLIFLEPRSAILYEQLKPRIMENKRDPCELAFSDFSDVSFKVVCSPETPNIVKVNIAMPCAAQLKDLGASNIISRAYPNMEVAPDAGFNVAIQFDCDAVANNEEFLNSISCLRRNIAAGPLDAAFRALLKKSSPASGVVAVNYRKNEFMYVCPSAVKVVVIFLVDFADITDKALARVFLQEFLEAQRLIRTGPPVSYSREPPGELASLNLGTKYNDTAGFISFSVEERLLTGAKLESTIDNLVGFRNYLHYHIKCSKTYLHMRMRKRVAGWMQILNRAVPEVDTEKKTASGKTFVRK